MPKAFQPRKGSSGRPSTPERSLLSKELAEEIRRTARVPDQRAAGARLGRAIELLERGDLPGATSEAVKAKSLAPRSAGAREVLGICLYQQGHWAEALAELKAYRRFTGRVDQNHLIADCLRALKRPADVVSLAEEELSGMAPPAAKAEAVVVAASALADEGRYSEALAFLRRARTKEQVAADFTLRLWYVKGDILARAGRNAEAAAEFRKIVRHDAGAFDAAERLSELS